MIRTALFLLFVPTLASAQTASLSLYEPPMRISKVRAGLWITDEEVGHATITFPSGKQLKTTHKLKRVVAVDPDDGSSIIAPTYVRKTRAGRTVDACLSTGTVDGDSGTGWLVLSLPPEPVRLERAGFLRFQVVAKAMVAPTRLEFRRHGKFEVEVWEGETLFGDCVADPVGFGLRQRVARELTATGTLKRVK